MYVKRNYGFFMTMFWSRKPFLLGLAYALVVNLTIHFLDTDFALPWQPVSVMGIAVAFYLGFKNNSSYDRTWEARKIWGGIVNSSRTFGAAVVTFVQGSDAPAIRRELIHRHVAWLTALRHQLRTPRSWEHDLGKDTNRNRPRITERPGPLCTNEMAQYLAPAELAALEHQSNMAAQLLKTQSVRLQQLREAGCFEDFRHMEFHRLIAEFYGEQGRAERIKNFPFPRQYASTALWLTFVFALFVPLSMVEVFPHRGGWIFWLSPFLSALIIWVFFLMEMIGDYSENPFEGTYNDVPITAISRTIEIDLREMLGETNIPGPVQAENGFLM
jgi:ion channel-forming bestrophin family protein